MKKVLISLSLLLLLASPTLAKDASPSARPRLEVKQKIVLRINEQLEHIKNQAVRHFNNVLERMGKLLDKIKARVPAVDITAAQAAIDTAQAAVDDLADNVYVIEFGDESGLRVGASGAKTKLRADIKAVREKVRLARQALVDVLKAAKEL